MSCQKRCIGNRTESSVSEVTCRLPGVCWKKMLPVGNFLLRRRKRNNCSIGNIRQLLQGKEFPTLCLLRKYGQREKIRGSVSLPKRIRRSAFSGRERKKEHGSFLKKRRKMWRTSSFPACPRHIILKMRNFYFFPLPTVRKRIKNFGNPKYTAFKKNITGRRKRKKISSAR